MNTPEPDPPFPYAIAAIMCAAAFAAILIWRLALPMAHRANLESIEDEIRAVPITAYGPEWQQEAELDGRIAEIKTLDAGMAAARRDFADTRDRLNIWLALSGLATLALAVPAFATLSRREPSRHPAAPPTETDPATPPG